jgi:protein-disulfide reductase (glutathione)
VPTATWTNDQAALPARLSGDRACGRSRGIVAGTLRSSAKLSALALGGALVLGACVEPPQRGDGNAGRGAKASDEGPDGPKRTATIPADGWNERIAWRGLDEGLREAAQTGMPLMMVVHTSWCGNCQKLKRTFNNDRTLEQLSEQFVMVHVDQEEFPEAMLYGPDGQYIPRVMFLDEDGNVDQRLQNPNRPHQHRYFYTPQEDLVATMRQALDRHGNKS